MKLLSMICVIAISWASMVLACRPNKGSSSSGSVNNCKEINKVKLTNITVLKVHRKYSVNQLRQAEVIKVNETYNRLAIDYDVKKGFPKNTIFSVQVLRFNPTSRKYYRKIHEYSISFCEDFYNEYFKYLPDQLIDLVKQGNCIPEGMNYKSEDTGYFKFYELLSDEELQDSRFKVITSLKRGRKILYSFELDFESNCKKNNLEANPYRKISTINLNVDES